MKTVEKTIHVTITLYEDGRAEYYFLEPESGDDVYYCDNEPNNSEFQKKLGKELQSWLPLMADEMKEQEDGQ